MGPGRRGCRSPGGSSRRGIEIKYESGAQLKARRGHRTGDGLAVGIPCVERSAGPRIAARIDDVPRVRKARRTHRRGMKARSSHSQGAEKQKAQNCVSLLFQNLPLAPSNLTKPRAEPDFFRLGPRSFLGRNHHDRVPFLCLWRSTCRGRNKTAAFLCLRTQGCRLKNGADQAIGIRLPAAQRKRSLSLSCP